MNRGDEEVLSQYRGAAVILAPARRTLSIVEVTNQREKQKSRKVEDERGKRRNRYSHQRSYTRPYAQLSSSGRSGSWRGGRGKEREREEEEERDRRRRGRRDTSPAQ